MANKTVYRLIKFEGEEEAVDRQIGMSLPTGNYQFIPQMSMQIAQWNPPDSSGWLDMAFRLDELEVVTPDMIRSRPKMEMKFDRTVREKRGELRVLRTNPKTGEAVDVTPCADCRVYDPGCPECARGTQGRD